MLVVIEKHIVNTEIFTLQKIFYYHRKYLSISELFSIRLTSTKLEANSAYVFPLTEELRPLDNILYSDKL